YGEVSAEVAQQLNQAKARGKRIICVGTTSVRLLESAARTGDDSKLSAFADWTGLFILPGYSFALPDALITNFHLPKSTLLMLVCAYAGTDRINSAYGKAIEHSYRFYSFGDAMLII
ncbi:S-adenosylmethionine:tRNA ribosyltransferase-isomerase, partial [Chloroflexota bacterium]